MAYLSKKCIKGITYYYAEERKRVNGISKRIWQKYLGPLHKIIDAVDNIPEKPKYAEIFELGFTAACLEVVKQINAVHIIDSIISKRNQGLSTGFYITLAAVNRAVCSTSKRSMWNWFKNTCLLHTFPTVNKEALSSQRFWDNMAKIKKDTIRKAWLEIINSVLDNNSIDLSSVSYDGTNFYTFIDSFNSRCSLPKRGKNKQGRKDLRQVSYALFCTRKDQIPLYFDVYEGNTHDTKEFSAVINKFFSEFEHRKPAKNGITIVFDKGNNSKDNFRKFINDSNYHFIGSVKVSDHKELASISNNDKCFDVCLNSKLEGVKAYRTKKEVYDKNLTVVVTFNNNLYTSQIKSINNEINKCLDKLSLIAVGLSDRRSGKTKKGKKPTVESVKKKALSICSGQYMKILIKVDVTEKNQIPFLSYKVNEKVYSELSDTYLGKNIIITDNHSWKTDEIILAYRSQYIVEDAFRQMKDSKNGSWWPMYHWTDNMIRVHGLYCCLSLLINSLLMKQTRENGVNISTNMLHEKLAGIREVINVFTKRNQSVVSKLDETQKKLYDIFNIGEYISS